MTKNVNENMSKCVCVVVQFMEQAKLYLIYRPNSDSIMMFFHCHHVGKRKKTILIIKSFLKILISAVKNFLRQLFRRFYSTLEGVRISSSS